MRQRTSERRRIRQHREEVHLHQIQQQQHAAAQGPIAGEQAVASLIETPTRAKPQTEEGRQLEPPLEFVGANGSSSSSKAPPPGGPAAAMTADFVSPVLPATPGQTSMLSPAADVRKLASNMSSDMFRPSVETSPRRYVQPSSSDSARNASIHLAHPVSSASAVTPGRHVAAEEDTLERGLELVLTAILEQSRGGKSSDNPANALNEAVATLFGNDHDISHLADDRFSRPSRKISAELGGELPDRSIDIPCTKGSRAHQTSIAEELLEDTDDEAKNSRDRKFAPSCRCRC